MIVGDTDEFTKEVDQRIAHLSEIEKDRLAEGLSKSLSFKLSEVQSWIRGDDQPHIIFRNLVMCWIKGHLHGHWIRKNFGTAAA